MCCSLTYQRFHLSRGLFIKMNICNWILEWSNMIKIFWNHHIQSPAQGLSLRPLAFKGCDGCLWVLMKLGFLIQTRVFFWNQPPFWGLFKYVRPKLISGWEVLEAFFVYLSTWQRSLFFEQSSYDDSLPKYSIFCFAFVIKKKKGERKKNEEWEKKDK